MEILINSKLQCIVENCRNGTQLKLLIGQVLGLPAERYYMICNGKRVNDNSDLEINVVHIVPRIVGGKGGFGSMLRAIGAQIEKTTNREACRDLSGRRLRDINEEQRLKNWINQQTEREKEAKDKKQKKLERLCEMPKHEFKDAQYDKERSELPEIVEDALTKGLQASCSTKRKNTEPKSVVKKKKAKLWMDDELDDDLSSSEEEDESEENKSSIKTSRFENSDSSESCKLSKSETCIVRTESESNDNHKAGGDVESISTNEEKVVEERTNKVGEKEEKIEGGDEKVQNSGEK